jgi:hypothetical protein
MSKKLLKALILGSIFFGELYSASLVASNKDEDPRVGYARRRQKEVDQSFEKLRKQEQARAEFEKVKNTAFKNFRNDPDVKNGSYFAQERRRILKKYGISNF